VSTWDLNEAITVPFPANSVNVPVDLQIVAGVNGWSYGTLVSGGVQNVTRRRYGESTGQFEKLAALWSTYRIKSVHIEFTPSTMAGIGAATPIISVVDVASAAGDFPSALTSFSKSRTL